MASSSGSFGTGELCCSDKMPAPQGLTPQSIVYPHHPHPHPHHQSVAISIIVIITIVIMIMTIIVIMDTLTSVTILSYLLTLSRLASSVVHHPHDSWLSQHSLMLWGVPCSWGTYWGESGWARVVRGVGSLGMELRGDWAVPALPPPARLPDAIKTDLGQAGQRLVKLSSNSDYHHHYDKVA